MEDQKPIEGEFIPAETEELKVSKASCRPDFNTIEKVGFVEGQPRIFVFHMPVRPQPAQPTGAAAFNPNSVYFKK